jgi:hypothetical protein
MENSDREQASIPPQLATPHFDDEATVISARRVVPIPAAKASASGRTFRRAAPFVLAAGLVGILIGAAIGYYEQRRLASAGVEGQSAQKPVENQSVADQSQITGRSQSAKADTQSKAATESPGDSLSRPNNVVADSTNTTSQFRRIHHLTAGIVSSTPRRKETSSAKRGAGRIQEIFAGPPPP